MSAHSVSQTFLGNKIFSFFNTFSCLGILYMYNHFRPMMITENDWNYLKNLRPELIDFSWVEIVCQLINRPNLAFVKAVLMDIYMKIDYKYWLVSTSVESQSNVENVNFR